MATDYLNNNGIDINVNLCICVLGSTLRSLTLLLSWSDINSFTFKQLQHLIFGHHSLYIFCSQKALFHFGLYFSCFDCHRMRWKIFLQQQFHDFFINVDTGCSWSYTYHNCSLWTSWPVPLITERICSFNSSIFAYSWNQLQYIFWNVFHIKLRSYIDI